MPTITTFLSYNDQAADAARFYVSLFDNSRIVATTRYGAAGPGPAGSVMTVTFELDGRPFVALNGGPHFKFTDAFSLSVACQTQEEIDRYWHALSDGGEAGPCGWIKDRFGLSWQVVPTILGELLGGVDQEKSRRAMAAMLTMKKLDIAALQRAHAGEP